jgi:hypothetical protein
MDKILFTAIVLRVLSEEDMKDLYSLRLLRELSRVSVLHC